MKRRESGLIDGCTVLNARGEVLPVTHCTVDYHTIPASQPVYHQTIRSADQQVSRTLSWTTDPVVPWPLDRAGFSGTFSPIRCEEHVGVVAGEVQSLAIQWSTVHGRRVFSSPPPPPPSPTPTPHLHIHPHQTYTFTRACPSACLPHTYTDRHGHQKARIHMLLRKYIGANTLTHVNIHTIRHTYRKHYDIHTIPYT